MVDRTINKPSESDEQFQVHILQGVSRTFALTIPVLPYPLSRVVSNAYLLCRIADTIEDDKYLSNTSKRTFSEQFIEVVSGSVDEEEFAQELYPELSSSVTSDEKELIRNTPAVIRITRSFNQRQRSALERCIRIMAEGMTRYQETDVRNGLKDQADMDRYCYYVAGVVGEMLTELFCDYSDEIDGNRSEFMKLAVSFGQGLQMTNILKDIWEDQKRGMCWLPKDVFLKYGSDLGNLSPDTINAGFQEALGEMLGIATAHLLNALQYTLLIPAYEQGIRRFCLWALGIAVLTLRKINSNRAFTNGQEVKVSRRSVRTTVLFTNLLTSHDKSLRLLFRLTARPLPKYDLSTIFTPASETVPKI